jgi:hypothetical protein
MLGSIEQIVPITEHSSIRESLSGNFPTKILCHV